MYFKEVRQYAQNKSIKSNVMYIPPLL